MWEKNYLVLKQLDEIVEYSSEYGFKNIKYPHDHGKENVYFMLHQKYTPLQEYENSTVKNEYDYLYKKDEGLKVIILQWKTRALLNMVTIV